MPDPMTGHTFINDPGEGGIEFQRDPAAEPLDDKPTDRELYQTLEAISELGWQAHIAWERIIGEQPLPDWFFLDAERQRRVTMMTQWTLEHPHASVSTQHDFWRSQLAGRGEQHKNAMPFEELPWKQQRKAHIWRHIIHAIVG